jgi:hypothetical protein
MVSSTSATRSVQTCTIFPCKDSRPRSQGKDPGCRPCHKGLAQRPLARAWRLPAADTARRNNSTVRRDKRIAHVRRSHTDQRQCSDCSRQHLHFRLPPNSPPRFHRKAGQSARGSASRFVGPLSSILNAPCSRQQPCNSVVPCSGACHAVKCILEVNYPPPCGLRERADTW